MRAWIAAVALVCACREADRAAPAPVPVPQTTPVRAPAERFGLYVLALSWAPSFCCSHAGKEECRGLADAYAGSHLTLHGLWPNYTDDEAAARHADYPEFCGDFARCKGGRDRSCEPDLAAIPDEMRTLGPGYVGDHDFLATHEWPKHGSCTGLSPADYFAAALAAMKALPGGGTPDALHAAIGGDVALPDLQRSFGIPPESVLLSCDGDCRLQQVSFCLGHDAANRPTAPVACPLVTTRARYDNGCVTRKCDRVIVPAAGSCAAPARKPREQRACNHPGQGPSCTGDAECVAAGFTRCARSGCCTSQP